MNETKLEKSSTKLKVKGKRSARKGSMLFLRNESSARVPEITQSSDSANVDITPFDKEEISVQVTDTKKRKSIESGGTVGSDIDYPLTDECNDREDYYKKLELYDREEEAEFNLKRKAVDEEIERKREKTERYSDAEEDVVGGDSHVAALLRAEMENNLREMERLYRRGSCFVRSDMITFSLPQIQESRPGTKHSRPYVGGFAAAAYEAAKGHHFSNELNMNGLKVVLEHAT